jgi:membrane protease YdiL (CAAX protease family)
MSGLPENDPLLHDPVAHEEDVARKERELLATIDKHFPYSVPEFEAPQDPLHPPEPPLFHSWAEREMFAPERRTPNMVDVGLLAILVVFGFLGSILFDRIALHFHWWGVSTIQRAANDVHYTIASMACVYVLAFGAALLVFPPLWQKGTFAGLQWNGLAALRRLTPLFTAAGFCFVLAMVDEFLLPGPATAPIDKLFDNRAAAWMLFGFGITIAPFFEESIFRGFLLPAVCTAFDWSIEQATKRPARRLDENGHPRWSLGAMIFASVATSIPFALMHAEQTAWSLGPFLLLVCVSLVLSWARLALRSLAASVIVHASYNFLLFSLMLLGTSGFKHLDKM